MIDLLIPGLIYLTNSILPEHFSFLSLRAVNCSENASWVIYESPRGRASYGVSPRGRASYGISPRGRASYNMALWEARPRGDLPLFQDLRLNTSTTPQVNSGIVNTIRKLTDSIV